MALLRHALAAAVLLLLAGCGGPSSSPPPPPQAPATAEPSELRKDFVILRELVKQHALQSEAENEMHAAAVERYLEEWLAKIPDEGVTDEEREIIRHARSLLSPEDGDLSE